MQITLIASEASASVAAEAKDIVRTAREAGLGSNRSNWSRIEAVLAACLSVIATGEACEVTHAFVSGNCPAYNMAHRVLSTELIRPYWNNVQVFALADAQFVALGEDTFQVTGTSNTTRKSGVSLFIGPPIK